MKAKKEDCDDDCGKDFEYHTKKGKKDDDKAKPVLTAAQKRKLSPEMQAAILKRKGKK
jgi:hypothetical protein